MNKTNPQGFGNLNATLGNNIRNNLNTSLRQQPQQNLEPHLTMRT